jgi:hypothetical protein
VEIEPGPPRVVVGLRDVTATVVRGTENADRAAIRAAEARSALP